MLNNYSKVLSIYSRDLLKVTMFLISQNDQLKLFAYSISHKILLASIINHIQMLNLKVFWEENLMITYFI